MLEIVLFVLCTLKIVTYLYFTISKQWTFNFWEGFFKMAAESRCVRGLGKECCLKRQ